MEIRILRYFMTVIREESITKAADVLHITQPTLSRQLAQMEEQLGVKLFERGTRKVTLTEKGILFHRRASEILELVDKAEKEMVVSQESITGTITIGCGDLASVNILADMIKQFHLLYPQINFEIYTASADHIKERIDHGLTDIGLLLEPIELSKYEFKRVKQKETWVGIIPSNDPLAHKAVLTPSDFINRPLILPHRLSMQSELGHWFGDIFEKLDVLIQSNLTSTGAVMVHQGLALSIVVEGSIAYWNQEYITYRPLSPELSATCVFAWKQKKPHSFAVTAFIQFIKEYLDQSNT